MCLSCFSSMVFSPVFLLCSVVVLCVMMTCSSLSCTQRHIYIFNVLHTHWLYVVCVCFFQHNPDQSERMAHASQLLLPHGSDVRCLRRRHQPNQIPHHLPDCESLICARFISAAHIRLNRLFTCASIIIWGVHVFLIASCVQSLTLMKMLCRLEWIHTEHHIVALKMLSCL